MCLPTQGLTQFLKTWRLFLILLEATISDPAKSDILFLCLMSDFSNSLGGTKMSIMTTCHKTGEIYEYTPLAKYCIKGDRTQLRLTTLSEEDIVLLEKQWVNRAKKFDHDLNAPETAIVTSRVVSPKTEWEKLLKEHQRHARYLDMNMADIKRFIKSFYLKQQKPIPREGDTRRYAYSLWALAQQKTDEIGVVEADGHEIIYMQ